MDEVFGSQNFVRQISYSKTTERQATQPIRCCNCDYLLWYARDIEVIEVPSNAIQG